MTDDLRRNQWLEEHSAGYHHGHIPQDARCIYAAGKTYAHAVCAPCADQRRMYPKDAA
jgi:hypothetical protein